ncbi:redoxin domain-containing protein [Patescibacteria group bacterium]|nr:redoxin domain-containing protein [Patescibacteria group bacterium]
MGKDKLIIAIGTLVTVTMLIGAIFLLSGNSGQNSSTNQAANTSLNDLVGKNAPDFTLESYNGDKTTLSSLKGKNVVLFFSEGLMCYPACWDQIAAFGKDNQFNDKNTVVLTIVNDPKNDWKGAVEKMPELAQATVLLDTNKKVSIAYDMLSLPSSMHKGQLPGHTYVVIDKEGIVKFVKDDVQMAVRNQELIAEIDKL